MRGRKIFMICLAVGRTIFYALPVCGRMRYTGKKEEILISAGGGGTDDFFGDDRRCAPWIRITHAIKPEENKNKLTLFPHRRLSYTVRRRTASCFLFFTLFTVFNKTRGQIFFTSIFFQLSLVIPRYHS